MIGEFVTALFSSLRAANYKLLYFLVVCGPGKGKEQVDIYRQLTKEIFLLHEGSCMMLK